MNGEQGVRKLIDFWKSGLERNPRCGVHPDDATSIRALKQEHETGADRTPEQKLLDRQVLKGKLKDPGPDFDLTPVPYLGDLLSEKTDIFLLMLNPSLEPADYYTHAKPEFREALIKNIKQECEPGASCLALDKKFWWSSWFTYYEKLLRGAICKYATLEHDGRYLPALEALACRLAIIELVPYYSRESGWITVSRARELPSSRMARDAARDLQRRAKAGKALLIMRWKRSKSLWGLNRSDGRITPVEGRGGFSDGNTAIFQWLRTHPAG